MTNNDPTEKQEEAPVERRRRTQMDPELAFFYKWITPAVIALIIALTIVD